MRESAKKAGEACMQAQELQEVMSYIDNSNVIMQHLPVVSALAGEHVQAMAQA